ncbi:MAG: phosphoadenosine phosphosulfate reductase family protein [Pseudomonadota bacterium]
MLFLDTRKLSPEPQKHRAQVTKALGLRKVRGIRPMPDRLAEQDPRADLRRADPDHCCDLRKTEPLRHALEGLAAWITSRKRFQGDNRSEIPTIEADRSTGRIKLNPLVLWTEDDIENYRRLRDLPAHTLLEKGYRSIGCVLCTRPAAPGESPRGRSDGLGLKRSNAGCTSTSEKKASFRVRERSRCDETPRAQRGWSRITTVPLLFALIPEAWAKGGVTITDDADEGLQYFKIVTPAAADFSRRVRPGSRMAGWYRGLPNMSTEFGHPGYAGAKGTTPDPKGAALPMAIVRRLEGNAEHNRPYSLGTL